MSAKVCDLQQTLPDDPSQDKLEWVFFIVNAVCFMAQTTLSTIVLVKLRGVKIERRNMHIMLAYVFTFLCKDIKIVTI